MTATGLASKTLSAVSLALVLMVFARSVRSSVLVVSRRAMRAMSASRAASRRPALEGVNATFVSVRLMPASTGLSACSCSMRPTKLPIAERLSVTFAGRFDVDLLAGDRAKAALEERALATRVVEPRDRAADVDAHARLLRGQRVAFVAELDDDGPQ